MSEFSPIVNIIDRIKFNIVKAMIDENMEPTDIIKRLKKYQICDYKMKSFKNDVLYFLNMEWNSKKKCWTRNNQISMYTYLAHNTLNNTQDIIHNHEKLNTPKAALKNSLKLNSSIKIPTIEELQLACTILEKDKEISVSANDAETLLKNMACIQAKLNEIARAVNKIATAINSNTNE